MTEQHMPARIWATEFEDRVELWTVKPKVYQHVFIRSDIAERMAEALELKLCPFCGGEAERIDIPSVGNDPELGGDPNAGGSCIQCKRCVASTALHFDRKENLYSSWNDRFMAGVAEQSGAGAPETSVRCGAPAALATLSPPAGERREAIARLIDPIAFRPKHIIGEGLSETEKEKWLRARNVAYYTADAILASGLVQDEAAIREREQAAQATLARIRKVRDGYADQAKFADVDPASYFREFVRRLDDAVNSKAKLPPWNGRSARNGGGS